MTHRSQMTCHAPPFFFFGCFLSSLCERAQLVLSFYCKELLFPPAGRIGFFSPVHGSGGARRTPSSLELPPPPWQGNNSAFSLRVFFFSFFRVITSFWTEQENTDDVLSFRKKRFFLLQMEVVETKDWFLFGRIVVRPLPTMGKDTKRPSS